MQVFMLLVSFFTLAVVCLIGLVVYKIIKNKTFPDNYYTPFDYITTQVPTEFHEEKEEEKEKDDEFGDDKNKNK
ncbi:DUF3951 domain-containing protein [Bacillus seohaeanensis]|jgi:hypothetical protein|uniref:DUF3951 domain-containing protein n=1 Tax=Bacillus seohaeanensis TaxID=284580 RepID=A0ABW5RVX3_9BACI